MTEEKNCSCEIEREFIRAETIKDIFGKLDRMIAQICEMGREDLEPREFRQTFFSGGKFNEAYGRIKEQYGFRG